MNKLKTILFAICSLVLVNVGTAMADSGNFAGPYVGVSVGAYGMSLDGTATDSSDAATATSTALSNIEVDEAHVGATTPITGWEAGYSLPVGSSFLLDVGAAYYTGEAKLEHTGDTSKKVTFTVNDLRTYYIAPTIVLSDTSSVYIKAGLSEADVTVTGDITSPGNLSGQTWALGTRTQLDSGIFIRTEAGYTEYNGISAQGKGTTIVSTTSYSVEPTVAYGSVSVGFRF